MTLKFTVEITMGNAAMQTACDLDAALTAMSAKITGHFGGYEPITDTRWAGGNVFDANGNNVGHWSIDEYCDQCEEKIAPSDFGAGHGMCGSCLHNAIRSGWTPGTTPQGGLTMTTLESHVYEKCRLCHFFVEPNDSYVPGGQIAEYIHLERGDMADDLFTATHDATPSGFKATLDTWRVFGPSAMRERFIDQPNESPQED